MNIAKSQCFDTVVVGCGGIGSAVLYHIAKRQSSVLGLEQFGWVHDRGSSHGQTRIIRQAYFEHADYVPLLIEAYDEWYRLERDRQRKLLYEIGLLQVGPEDGQVVPGVLKSASTHGLAIEALDQGSLEKRFPLFRAPEGHVGAFESKAGYLLVEECVRSHLDGARQAGAQALDHCRLTGVSTTDQGIELTTTRGVFLAQQVVLTVGAWLKDWLQLSHQPLKVLKKHLHWFDPDRKEYFDTRECPLFLFEVAEGCFYGFPAIDGRGMKVAEHSGGECLEELDSIERGLDRDDLARVTQFMGRAMRGTFRHREHQTCMYTMTKDSHFLIDHHPMDQRILLAGGFSGHGFKFASILGKLISDWIVDRRWDSRLRFLGLNR